MTEPETADVMYQRRAAPVEGEISMPVNMATVAGHMPIMSTTIFALCYHDFPPEPAAAGGSFTCSKCGKTFFTRFKRPPRQPKDWCSDCGTVLSKKGPKMPKRWVWVEDERKS